MAENSLEMFRVQELTGLGAEIDVQASFGIGMISSFQVLRVLRRGLKHQARPNSNVPGGLHVALLLPFRIHV